MMQTNKQDQRKKIEDEIHFYDKLLSNHSAVKDGLNILKTQRDITVPNLKESCMVELKRFIDARGMIERSTGRVHLPRLSTAPQNAARVTQSILDADRLMHHLENATSLSELDEKLQQFISDNTTLSDDLMMTISQCLNITSRFKSHGL